MQSTAKVVYKKQSGQLSLNSDESVLCFSTATTTTTAPTAKTVEIKIAQIKGIFVNAPGSAKCLLRVVTRDDQPHLFQFIDAQSAMQDRDRFKDRISILINALALGAASTAVIATVNLSADDIRRRQMLLAQNINLRRLHRDLVVVGKHLSEEQFWSVRGGLLAEAEEKERQQTGMSTEIVHDIRPSTTSEGSDIKYTLTPEIIQSIFLHHPKIKKAFDEHVPGKLDEKQFWTRCFQSAFFYRDRQTQSSSGAFSSKASFKDQIFDKLAAEEETELLNPDRSGSNLAISSSSFLLDLVKAEDDSIEGYGNEPDVTMRKGKVQAALPIIRRLNMHGEIVLKQQPVGQKRKQDDNNNGCSGGGSSSSSSSNLPRHKQLLRSVMSIEDLQPTEPVKPIYLNIKDQQVYFSKGVGEEELITPTTTTATASLQPRPQSFTQLLQSVIDDWDVRVHRFSTTRDAKHCLQAQLEIDRRLSIQRQSDDSNPQASLPPDTFQEIVNLSLSVNELLKHFWAGRRQRVDDASQCKKLKESLLQFQCQQIQPLIDGDSSGAALQLLKPLMEAISWALQQQQ